MTVFCSNLDCKKNKDGVCQAGNIRLEQLSHAGEFQLFWCSERDDPHGKGGKVLLLLRLIWLFCEAVTFRLIGYSVTSF